jgi:hypothetical protein
MTKPFDGASDRPILCPSPTVLLGCSCFAKTGDGLPEYFQKASSALATKPLPAVRPQLIRFQPRGRVPLRTHGL